MKANCEALEVYIYQLFGLNVKTDVKLLGEELAEDVCVDVEMTASLLEEIYKDIRENVYAQIGEGEECPSVVHKHEKRESIVWVQEVGVFRITDGKLIEYRCFQTTDDLRFQQWLMAMAFSIMMIQREKILLHGAALRLPNIDRVIGVCGESGAGKSTISDELMKRGFRFLSDDEILFDVGENIYSIGTYPWRRICLDVYEKEYKNDEKAYYFEDGDKQKYVIDMSEAYDARKKEIDKLFVLTLTEGESVEVEPVVGADKIPILLTYLFKKAVYEKLGIPPQMFKEIVQIASKVDIYNIKRPIDKVTIDEITDKIIKLVDGE